MVLQNYFLILMAFGVIILFIRYVLPLSFECAGAITYYFLFHFLNLNSCTMYKILSFRKRFKIAYKQLN